MQLLLTAGIGSDHIDLNAAAEAGLTVAEVTGSNVVSVAEDELMRILILVRNFLPGYHQVINGDWNVAAIAYRAYDLEGKTVGTVGAGRIGKLLLQRLKPFNCNLLYHDRLKMAPELEKEIGAKFEEDLDAMLAKCDVVVINTPLTDKTRCSFAGLSYFFYMSLDVLLVYFFEISFIKIPILLLVRTILPINYQLIKH